MVFSEKKLDFVGIAKGSKFTVECNWMSKISQNLRNLVSSWKNKLVFRKNSWFFLNSPKVANLHYKATKKVRILKMFEKLVFFFKNMDGFFPQKNPISQKNDKGSKFAVECNWINKISQNFQILVFLKKKIGFLKKLFS